MNTHNTPSRKDIIAEMLGLQDLTDETQHLFLEDVGGLIIESTVLRYTATLSDLERITFETWLEENHLSETLIDEVCEVFPEFSVLLAEEMEALQREIEKIAAAQAR